MAVADRQCPTSAFLLILLVALASGCGSDSDGPTTEGDFGATATRNADRSVQAAVASPSPATDLLATDPTSEGTTASQLAEPDHTAVSHVDSDHDADGASGTLSPDSLVHLEPLRSRSPRSGPMLQRLAPEETGIQDVQRVDTTHPLKRLYVTTHASGGIAVGDVNGDGHVDVYVVNNSGLNRLYLQKEEFQFTDLTEAAKVDGGDAWGCGAAMVDIDGDQDLDIYVCNYESPNQLFINDGADPPTFSEQAEATGLDVRTASVMPYFCDYDLDGDLDVYIVCYRLVYPTGTPEEQVYVASGNRLRVKTKYERYFDAIRLTGRRVYVTERGCEDYLFRNDGPDVEGDLRFTDVTKMAGINGALMGISAAWWDYDEDGYPDLYVANDFEHVDRFYRNRGDGTFVDEIRYIVPHTPYSAMGSCIGDIDGNQHLDLVVLDMASTTHFKEKVNMGEMGGVQQFVMDFSEPRQIMRNALYLNSGVGRMTEAALLAGLAKSDWSWSPLIEDFDQDGMADVLVTNGMSRNLTDSDVRVELKTPGKTEWDYFESQPPYRERNLAMRNRGDLRFENVSRDWGFDRETMSFAAATADFDRDGDLDLITVDLDETPAVYRNNATGNRLVVSLRSWEDNTHGIGSRIQVETGIGKQIRMIAPMRGFAATSQAVAHFGLGDAETVKRLTVLWPDGRQQIHDHIPANHHVTLTRDRAATKPWKPKTKTKTLYQVQRLNEVRRHIDAASDDFAHQPLLPNRLSQLGPCIACGDYDANGRIDLFVGGAAGKSGVLYRHSADDSLEPIVEPFVADSAAEDMGALFLDADRDGDLDLYVASGSYEFAPDSDALVDRLYVNDNGTYRRAMDALPDARNASSVVAAADVDRDGDLDLFVGSRVVPREYPVVPESRLLINQSGVDGDSLNGIRFIDATKSRAPDLQQTGLVTSATWSDVNGDGWTDLLVTHEWGPVKLYLNREGMLHDATETAGLSTYKGWWNGIAARDFDNDGDIDYVVTNFGLNTKYRASMEKPIYVYFGDYGGTGRMNIVEAKATNGGLLPVRGKSCSSNAMPHLKGRFTTFRQFATASLADIYTGEALARSLRHEANTLESGVLVNRSERGTTEFTFIPLPRRAQISPGFGVVATEVNGDAHADIYLAQNFYTPQRETGRMDGGLSVLLTGNGDGTFDVVAPDESGLLLPGDAKALAAIDWNDDARPDFIASRNNDFPKAFVSAPSSSNSLRVCLVANGQNGNIDAVGAMVAVYDSKGTCQSAEVIAGGSYLSQSAPCLFFGVPDPIDHIDVRWPDGTLTRHEPKNSTASWRHGGPCVLKQEGNTRR